MHYLFKLLSLIIFGLALAAGYYALQLFINQSSLAGYTLAMLLIIIGAALLINRTRPVSVSPMERCRQGTRQFRRYGMWWLFNKINPHSQPKTPLPPSKQQLTNKRLFTTRCILYI